MELDDPASPCPSASSSSSDLSPPVLSLDELAERIVALSGRLTAAMCRWLLLVADFDEREGYLPFGLASTAQWLTHACGIAHRTAVEHLRVARSLREHPQLAEEMAAGRLSFSQVRAISRIAEPDEHALVQDLIEAAQHATVAQLETVVRGLRTVDHNEQATDPGEYLTHSWTADSRWHLSARLDPERGAMVGAAIQALIDRDGGSPADALVQLAQIGLAALADGKKPPRDLRGHETTAVIIHLDATKIPTPQNEPLPRSAQRDPDQQLADPDQTPAPRSAERGPDRAPRVARPYARIAGGPGLPDRVVQRLLCDGRIRTIIHNSVIHNGGIHDASSHVLDVGRSHRLVTDRQYRVLLARHHNHCAHPGCPNTKNLHAHHHIHWIHGGRTDLANLLLLCEPHHVAHHAGQFQIHTTGPGRFRFIAANGRDLSTRRRNTANPDTGPIEDEHPDIAPNAATPKWDGQRLNRHYAISVLAQRRQAAS